MSEITPAFETATVGLKHHRRPTLQPLNAIYVVPAAWHHHVGTFIQLLHEPTHRPTERRRALGPSEFNELCDRLQDRNDAEIEHPGQAWKSTAYPTTSPNAQSPTTIDTAST